MNNPGDKNGVTPIRADLMFGLFVTPDRQIHVQQNAPTAQVLQTLASIMEQMRVRAAMEAFAAQDRMVQPVNGVLPRIG